MKIVFAGRCPSKKNAKQIVYVKGRPLIISSKDYKQWHEEQMWFLKSKRLKPFTEPVRVRIESYSENKRKYDLSNKAESILDLLVDAGILPDDNYSVVPELTLLYKGVDKESPRSEVTIDLYS